MDVNNVWCLVMILKSFCIFVADNHPQLVWWPKHDDVPPMRYSIFVYVVFFQHIPPLFFYFLGDKKQQVTSRYLPREKYYQKPYMTKKSYLVILFSIYLGHDHDKNCKYNAWKWKVWVNDNTIDDRVHEQAHRFYK